MSKKGNLLEISKVFFKLGCIGFGGPAAHIAMMESEIIEKRKWMTHEHFLDLIGATNLIPGPNSTEMTMHCGHERGGIPGLFIAGISFVFPAVVISGILGYLYFTYGQLPEVQPFIMGIKPAVLAIIAGSIFKLSNKAIKSWELAILGVLVLIASLMGFNEILALLTGGIIGTAYFWSKHQLSSNHHGFLPILLLQIVPSSTKFIGGASVFWTFLKVGAILYGSGYVLFAYLDAALVDNGLMSRQVLMDAIAVGQFTPGPVLSTATFIGYQLGGITGAITASIGIFLPSFIFVMLLNPLVKKMRSSKLLSYFLDSVNVAAVAIMAAVLLVMAKESIVDWRSALIAVLSFIIVFWYKKSSTAALVIGSAILGYGLSLI